MIQGGQAADPNVVSATGFGPPKLPPAGGSGVWPCYVGVEPDSPDECITLDDTTGQGDGRDMNGGELNAHMGLQFRFRSLTAKSGWTKAQAVRAWLSEQVFAMTVTIDSSTYRVHCFSKIGQVLKLGTDGPNSKRWLHTLNAMISIRQLS